MGIFVGREIYFPHFSAGFQILSHSEVTVSKSRGDQSQNGRGCQGGAQEFGGLRRTNPRIVASFCKVTRQNAKSNQV